MIINIPGELYTMEAKRSIIKFNAEPYKKASKKEKNEMLNDLEAVLQLHRKHITKLLNNTNKVYYTPSGIKLVGDPTVTYLHKRGRKKKYTHQLVPYLKAIWVLSHYRSSAHLKAFILNNQDWLLAKIKEEYKLKQRYRPHPHASVLKRKILVEPHYHKNDNPVFRR